jgi:hypothetical protein
MPTIATVVYGKVDLVRLAENIEIEGRYPTEELRRLKTGRANLIFRIGVDGGVTGMSPTVYTSDAFNEAAQSMLGGLRFYRLDASLPPDTPYRASVTFTLPPCIATQPVFDTELAITICGSRDVNLALRWDQPWQPDTAYPAAFNRTQPGAQTRRLQFLGVWQGTKGATEFAPGVIRSGGTLLGEYSVVAHEEFVAVLEVTSALYPSAKYWRLDAIDYTRCQVAGDGSNCARPYEPGTRLVLTMYQDVNDALSFSPQNSGTIHYLSFRESP